MRQKIWAFIAAAFAGVALAIMWAGNSGFTDYSPGVQTIMGASVCTGSPTTDALLVYGGSTWCGSTVNNAPLISGTASSLTIKSAAGNGAYVTVEPNGTTSGFAIGGSGNGGFFVYDNAAGIAAMQYAPSSNVLEVAPIGWDRGADLTQTNESRTPWSCYLRTVSGVGTAKAICEYYPAKNTHIQTISYAGLTAAAGCTTNPVVALFDGSTEITASAITLTTNSAVAAQSVGYAFTGGHALSLQVATAPAGCTTSAADYTFTAELTTD